MINFTPTDEQLELCDQLCKWFKDYESGHRIRNHPQWFSYSGGAGTGKAIPDDDLILTPTGMRYVKDIKVGDYLFDANGNPTKVLGVYPQAPDMIYELTFNDGRTARSTKNHLWPVYLDYSDKKYKVKTLESFMNRYTLGPIQKSGKQSKRIKIPSINPIEFEYTKPEIDPWVFGVFIGNGCLRDRRLTISSGVDCIPKMVGEIYNWETIKVSKYDYDYKFRDKVTNKYISTKEFFINYPDMINKYSYEKYIPDIYKYNSIEVRMNILSGLLDTDGYICPPYYNVRYSTVSSRLRDDIIFIARSLGFQSYYLTDKRNKYTTGECYEIYIKCQNNIKPYLFRHPKKHAIAIEGLNRNSSTRYDRLTLRGIKCIGIKNNRCFYVDNPEHLFITGDFVPTHNTTIVKEVIDKLRLDDDQYITCAYTGRAALNLQQKGLPSCTVHSLIYHTLLEKVPYVDEDSGETKYKMGFHFILKESLPENLRLIVVDEATMINNDMRDKILGFGKPTIFIGDMNQLPPIFGVSDVMLYPDFKLTKIMRQNEGNPIIQLSQMILNDDYYDFGDYGDSKVISSIEFGPNLVKDYDMILCGKNKTRDYLNNRIIKEVIGKKTLQPFIGAKVVNRQNNWNLAVKGISLTNGLVGYITNFSKRKSYQGYYTIDFRPDFMDDEFEDLKIDCKYILSDYDRRKNYGMTKFEKFEYAYCITTHISQGSQYNRVLFFDEPFADKETTKKLRYTAITRAIDNITIVRSAKSYTPRTMWNSEAYNEYRRNY